MKPDFRRSMIASIVVCLLFASTTYAEKVAKGLSAGDAAAVRAVLERYQTTWLANDESGVLSTFAPEAVLMPAHGNAPVDGLAAIKQYWWPQSATKTTITKFVQKLDEVGGNETLAYARGNSDVEWRTEDKGTAQNWQNSSSFLFLLKRRADGMWLITHLIWDAGENKLLK